VSDFSKVRHIKAVRKTHYCYPCGKTIWKGDSYYYHVGNVDNRFQWLRECIGCQHERVERYGHAI